MSPFEGETQPLKTGSKLVIYSYILMDVMFTLLISSFINHMGLLFESLRYVPLEIRINFKLNRRSKNGF